MPQADVRALVEYVVRGLADHPEAVSVRVAERDRVVHIEVKVAPEDMGKIIGRRGRMIGAIRALARAAALRSGRRVVVDVAH